MTRVAIHAIPDGGGTSIKLTQIDILDEDIAPDIDRIIDEDRLGSGSPIDETADRGSPNPTTPSTTVIKKQEGQNNAIYEVDPDTGRPVAATATLREDFGSRTGGDNATEIGHIGGEGHDGGHLIAHRFMGDTVDGGIAPQVRNLNRGAWSTMENEWGQWLTKYKPQSGRHVEIDVRIDVDPPGADVPDGFDVEYKVFEADANGNRVEIHNDAQYFDNADGTEFERIYFRSDGTRQTVR